MQKPVLPPKMIKQNFSVRINSGANLEQVFDAKHSLLNKLPSTECNPPVFTLKVVKGSSFDYSSYLELHMLAEIEDPEYTVKMEKYQSRVADYRKYLQNTIDRNQKELESTWKENV